MVGHRSAEELAAGLPEQWRGGFVHFVETGEADERLLEFLDTDKAAQAAVEAAFNETADALKGIAEALRAIGNARPNIGDLMPASHPQAGWIYMGPDEETGEVFYAAPKDESGPFTFNQAAKRAASTGAKVPSQSQLDKMYRNRDKGALKGTFNVTGSYPAGWYWSSSQASSLAWAHRFSDGTQTSNFRNDNDSSLRLVR
jgi:hypothetical protein